MKDSVQKGLKKSVIFVVGIAMLVFFAVSFFRMYFRQKEADNDITDLIEEVQQLEKRNGDLAKIIEYFQTESFVEAEARAKLNVKKQGEEVVVIPEKDSSKVSIGNGEGGKENAFSSPALGANTSNPKLWWNYFFGSR